jgi:hypothetical protein
MGAVRTGLRRACVALLARSRAGPSGARVSGAAFPPATVGVSPTEAVRAALASSSLGTPRAFHVDPKDKDQWEAFVLGLPATLAKDLEYRKKVFVEVDKGTRALSDARGRIVTPRVFVSSPLAR